MSTENIIKKQLAQCGTLLLIGTLTPVLALTLDWLPDKETTATWFQRSGSILVIFSVLAEIKLLPLHNTLFPGDHTITEPVPDMDNLGVFYKTLTYISAVFAILGTVIWGYGDLIYNNITSHCS